MSSGNRSDILGRAVGMLVFLIGVGLLIVVFTKAFSLFGTRPADALGLAFTGDPKRDPSLGLIGVKFGWLLFEIAFLFVMAVAGSFVAQKGINLYFHAIQGTPGAGHSGVTPPQPPAGPV